MLARDFVHSKPRKRKSVALVAWGDDGGGAFYVVGTLVAVEVTAGGGGLRMELAREGGRVAAERRLVGTAAGGAFSGQRCALLLDGQCACGKVCDGPAEGAGADATVNVRL